MFKLLLICAVIGLVAALSVGDESDAHDGVDFSANTESDDGPVWIGPNGEKLTIPEDVMTPNVSSKYVIPHN